MLFSREYLLLALSSGMLENHAYPHFIFSFHRYHGLFDPTFKNFDGYSTTHPASNIQRVYAQAFLNASDFISLDKMQNFSSLIKAASYVAGDCHKRDSANSNRDHIVHRIRRAGFRVEGLGRCMHTTNPEGDDLFEPDRHYLILTEDSQRFRS